MNNQPLSMSFTDTQTIDGVASSTTPVFLYSESRLRKAAAEVRDFGGPYGFTPRYAMKANPHPKILQIFNEMGISIDASSGGEVERALEAGVPAGRIVLNSQQLPDNLKELIELGIEFTATSLYQLEAFGQMFPGKSVAVRINPGMGSGSNNRLTTGGVNAGFGIWHEYIPKVKELARQHDLTIDKVHTHIGSGTDPEAWEAAAHLSLELVEQFEDAVRINLGGGFKVGRMPHEPSTDLRVVSEYISRILVNFYERTGRKLILEIEPGTYLVALAGALLAEVIDVTDTGPNGYNFLRVNTGMNDILRPSLYGAQHPLVVLPKAPTDEVAEYIVVGHCCESGDMLTVAPGNPEQLEPRTLAKAQRGDLLLIEGAGAYCAGMRARGYNSFEPAGEIFIP